MNEEKLKEALKIIKEPITVNSVNYKYFDEINYDKLIMVYDNCLWFANNLEQLTSNLDQLQQENQQLKEQIEYLRRSIERKEETIIDLRVENGLDNSEKEIIDYLKEQINECKLTGNDEDYVKIDAYEEILSKIEKSDK